MNVGVRLMLLLYTVFSSSMMWFSACSSVLLAGVALGFYFFCIIVPHSTKTICHFVGSIIGALYFPGVSWNRYTPWPFAERGRLQSYIWDHVCTRGNFILLSFFERMACQAVPCQICISNTSLTWVCRSLAQQTHIEASRCLLPGTCWQATQSLLTLMISCLSSNGGPFPHLVGSCVKNLHSIQSMSWFTLKMSLSLP